MNRKVYSYLLHTYGHRPAYWLGLCLTVVQTILLRVVVVIIIARLAAAVVAGDLRAARIYILLHLGVAVTGLILRLSREFIANRAEAKVFGDMIVTFYRKLTGKDMSFYRDHQTGYLASMYRQHVDGTWDLARLLRGEMVQTLISLVLPTAVLFVASWKVGVVALGVIIVQAMYIFWASSMANKHRERSHEIYRKVSGAVSDDVTNIVAYKTSGQHANAIARMRELATEQTETFWQRRKVVALLDAPRDIVTVAGTVLAFWIIVGSTATTGDSVALIVLTTTYMFRLFETVSGLPDLIIKHDDLITQIYPTLEYLTGKNEQIKDPAKPRRFPKQGKGKIGGRIDIANMSFAYQVSTRVQPKTALTPNPSPPSSSDSAASSTMVPVFDGLELHIEGGQQVGVVGLSGAGKSTLASLLMRFDDVTGGSISIDGVDIRQVRQADLRARIAYVPQEPLLFHRTIRENVQYFSPDVYADETAMIRAAKAAHAHEFITGLPNGYDTLVGERGIKLSGGQKQRVVIARAILKDAPIMVFDEATSALDSESEKIIQKALPGIIGRRTAIVIAHRLSTVAGLDRIIVMHHGKIVEDGTHAELLKLKGRYYSLWQKQTRG